VFSRQKRDFNATSISYFHDSLGQQVERGDVIAYATENYDSVYLRVAEVVDMEVRETFRWTDQKYWIKVKPEGQSPRMIHGPNRTVLVTKGASRLNG
jgi:hypothetical protein